MSTGENAALDALQRSRERMRQALREALISAPDGSGGGLFGGDGRSTAGLYGSHRNGPSAALSTDPRVAAGLGSWTWLAPLRTLPGVGPVLDRALRWWAPHPLRQAAAMLGTAAQAVVRPVAQKHPLALVLGAAAVGGLLVISRPWRLLITPALLASVAPRLLANVVGQIPRGSWLTLLTAMLPSARKAAADMPRASAPAVANPNISPSMNSVDHPVAGAAPPYAAAGPGYPPPPRPAADRV